MSARLHPMCRVCGWAMGGIDSWNGRACKCGHTAAPFPDFEAEEAEEWRAMIEPAIDAVIKRRLERSNGPERDAAQPRSCLPA